jgi:hypothetical protein
MIAVVIDSLDAINRRYGPQWADTVMQSLAAIIQTSVRSGDLVARLASNELGVFLPGATVENAQDVGTRIRRRVAEASFSAGDAPLSSASSSAAPCSKALPISTISASWPTKWRWNVAAPTRRMPCRFRGCRLPEGRTCVSESGFLWGRRWRLFSFVGAFALWKHPAIMSMPLRRQRQEPNCARLLPTKQTLAARNLNAPVSCRRQGAPDSATSTLQHATWCQVRNASCDSGATTIDSHPTMRPRLAWLTSPTRQNAKRRLRAFPDVVCRGCAPCRSVSRRAAR